MEMTYMVRGADGKEYGPVTVEQLGAWVREGRLLPQGEIRRSDMQHWAAASSFEELRTFFVPPGAVSPPIMPGSIIPPTQPAAPAAGQVRSGASWFYWIAALSLVNSIVAFTGSSWRFILGLGITQIIDGMAQHGEGSSAAVALILNFLVAAVFVVLGIFAHKGQLWAFIVGMILFALDGVIFLLAQDWIGVAFHAFVLYCFFRGFNACRRLRG